MDRFLAKKSVATTGSLSQPRLYFRDCLLPVGWEVHEKSLLVFRHGKEQVAPRKVVVLDFDDTLVRRGSRDGLSALSLPRDLCSQNVVPVLRRLSDNGYSIVILTNEANLQRLKKKEAIESALRSKTSRLSAFLELLEGISVLALIATGQDKFRKGEGIGAWEYLVTTSGGALMSGDSIMCGDAAGRQRDFSDSDRAFAVAAGLRFFTPEEFFGLEEVSIIDTLCCIKAPGQSGDGTPASLGEPSLAKRPRLCQDFGADQENDCSDINFNQE